MYDYIISLDPSGAFYEGKGTTGICMFDANRMLVNWVDDIKATDFESMEEYWDAHCLMIQDTIKYYHFDKKKVIIVIEDYLLYQSKVVDQINSRMETPKLIGVLQHFCWQQGYNYYMQAAARVINRWDDDILVYKKYIRRKGRGFVTLDGESISKHKRDSIRHAVHFAEFKNKEK